MRLQDLLIYGISLSERELEYVKPNSLTIFKVSSVISPSGIRNPVTTLPHISSIFSFALFNMFLCVLLSSFARFSW